MVNNLKSFSFFSTLPTRELEKLNKQCRYQQYTSGTKIVIEREEIKELILVVEGQLSVLKNYGGEKKTLFNLDPGDVYGEVEILNGTKALATLIGYQEFKLMFIPKEVYLRLIGLYQGFAKESRDLYARRANLLLEDTSNKGQPARVITFFNVKGGAGKSVISANVATMLARFWKKRVVLIDLNLAFGDQAILLGLNSDKNIHKLVKKKSLSLPLIEEQLTLHQPSGLKVLLPPSLPEQAESVKPELVERIVDLLRPNYDFIIIDTHNQLTDLELKILDLSNLIMLVMTMELTFIKNTKLLLDLFHRLKIPREKVKVILNRAFKSLGLEPSKVEKSLRYAISYFIPSEGEIVVPSVNKGIPFVLSKGSDGSGILASVRQICSSIAGENTDNGTWSMFALFKEVFGIG